MSSDDVTGNSPDISSTALVKVLSGRRGELLRFIESRLGSALRRKVEPEDIFQEVSAEALRSWPTVARQQSDCFGWLCSLVEWRIIDAYRHFFAAQKRDAAREVSAGPTSEEQSRRAVVDLLAATMTTASQVFSRNERELRLMQALVQLTGEQREAVRLRYFEGMPSKQIAERMGKTDGSVRVLLTRSLGRLQELLAAGE